MTKVEIAKLKLELVNVKAAKADMEFKILVREEEIEKLKEFIEVQDKKIEEIEAKLVPG